MEVVDLTGANPRLVQRLVVPGNPVAMPRPRVQWRRKFFHNPASNKVTAFKAIVKAAIPATQNAVVFPSGVPLTVSIAFHMRRPNTDFVGGNRLAGALKGAAPAARPIGPDIDNLAKFILDGLNGVLFQDDRQVVQLTALKLLDNEQGCNGRTVIEVAVFDP